MKSEEKEYRIQYKEQFLEDVQAYRRARQKSILIKINSLIEELRRHPAIGTGSPEPLKGDRKGQWSRRIIGKHRLIYEIHEDVITVILISAYGHYGDK